MKKLILLAAIYLMMLGTLAADPNETIIVIEKQKNSKVLVGSQLQGKVKVCIVNSTGNTIYVSKMKVDGIKLIKYDISNLPKGEYTFKVSTIDYEVQKTLSF